MTPDGRAIVRRSRIARAAVRMRRNVLEVASRFSMRSRDLDTRSSCELGAVFALTADVHSFLDASDLHSLLEPRRQGGSRTLGARYMG